jgi:hypothetical protein
MEQKDLNVLLEWLDGRSWRLIGRDIADGASPLFTAIGPNNSGMLLKLLQIAPSLIRSIIQND